MVLETNWEESRIKPQRISGGINERTTVGIPNRIPHKKNRGGISKGIPREILEENLSRTNGGILGKIQKKSLTDFQKELMNSRRNLEVWIFCTTSSNTVSHRGILEKSPEIFQNKLFESWKNVTTVITGDIRYPCMNSRKSFRK